MIFDFPLGASPEMLALTILVSTFFLEDIAIGYAGFLAAAGMISPSLAFIALFLGVYLGDLGLYFLGVGAKHHKRIRRFIGEDRVRQAGKWLRRRSVITLIGARMVPGSRLPIYAASGFLHLPFATFASTTAATSLVWTFALFITVYAFGISATDLFGPFKYVAAAGMAAAVFGAPFLWTRLVARSSNAIPV
ncbi:MAG TPA: VTT domain-containing protein [Rhizomicrobium sp.]